MKIVIVTILAVMAINDLIDTKMILVKIKTPKAEPLSALNDADKKYRARNNYSMRQNEKSQDLTKNEPNVKMNPLVLMAKPEEWGSCQECNWRNTIDLEECSLLLSTDATKGIQCFKDLKKINPVSDDRPHGCRFCICQWLKRFAIKLIELSQLFCEPAKAREVCRGDELDIENERFPECGNGLTCRMTSPLSKWGICTTDYYAGKPGEVCKNEKDVIRSQEECATAVQAVGFKLLDLWPLRNDLLWRGDKIPAGCSRRNGGDGTSCFEISRTGLGFGRKDLIPICKK